MDLRAFEPDSETTRQRPLARLVYRVLFRLATRLVI